MSEATITAASVPLYLDDQEFTASPFSDKDFDELTEWIQARIMQTTLKSLPKDNPELRSEVIRETSMAVAQTTWDSPEGQKIGFMSKDGICRIIWMLVRKHHENTKPSDFAKYLTDETNAHNYMFVFKKLHPHLISNKEEDVYVPDASGALKKGSRGTQKKKRKSIKS